MMPIEFSTDEVARGEARPKPCPQCGQQTLALITSAMDEEPEEGDLFCWRCAPRTGFAGEIFVARKLDRLHAEGRLQDYDLQARLDDLLHPPN